MNELQTAIWKAKEALLLNKFFFTKSIIFLTARTLMIKLSRQYVTELDNIINTNRWYSIFLTISYGFTKSIEKMEILTISELKANYCWLGPCILQIWWLICLGLSETISVVRYCLKISLSANLIKLINFYSLWNHQEIKGFLMILGGIELNFSTRH